MKTRLLFATMVLPALFAACTNDEIVDSQSPSLDGRALLDPNFTITVNGEADTRFSWTEDGYKWNDFTANDKFSAGLLTDANSANVLTNYVFSTKDGSAYTTTSQMVEGVYLFYSYPGFETNAKSEPVAFDLTSQVSTDLTKPADVVNAEKGQLFITPLYQLDAETANEKLGMTFISYWSTAVIPVTNATSESFKIARIVLKATGENKFLVKGTIDPSAMNTAGLIYKYDKDKGTYVLGKKGDKAAEYDDLRVADIAKAGEGNRTVVDQLVVNCGSYELAAGKSVTAYIQVPAGSYEDGMMVEVVAEVSKVGEDGKTVTSLKSLETKAELNYKSNDKLAANDVIRFRRSKATSVFGVAADNTPKAYKVEQVDLDFAEAAEGLYANTYDEVYKYVAEATAGSTVTIYNQGSLKVDDSMMALLGKAGKKVKFLNPIEISSDRAKADLMNVEFDGGAAIKKGAITFGAGVKLAAEKVLTIEKGATARIGTDASSVAFAGKINNKGTLQLAGSTAVEVANDKEAIVEVVENQTIGTDGITTFNTPAILKVAKGKTLTIAASKAQIIGVGQKVENNGVITTAAADFTNKGVIDNYGTISNVTNENGDLTNGKMNIAVINNYGTISSVLNKYDESKGAALIVMGSDAEISATATGSTGGEIDNTKNGFIKANDNGCVVYAEFSGNKTGNFASNISGCTKVILKNGTWSEPELNAKVVTLKLDGVTLASKDNAEITLGNVTDLTMKNSGSESPLTFAKATKVDLSGSTFGGAVKLTAEDGFTAIDLAGVTFNGALTFGSKLATINIEPANVGGKDVEATTSFGGTVTATGLTALNIAKKATLKTTESGSIGSTSSTVVKNNGHVENRGTISGTTGSDVDGDDGTATWIRNELKTAS